MLPDGSVAENPLSDFLEPRSAEVPPLGEVVQVRALPRVATERVEVTRPPTRRPGLVPSPCIDWRGFSSWEDFVRRTSKRQWRAFKVTKRKRRKLGRELGPVRTDVDIPDHDLVEQALLHKARQLRRTKGLDRFVSRRVRQLVHRLVEEGHLTLSVLWAGGRPLAFALAHWGTDRLCCWINSYDPEAGAYSPGTLLYEDLMAESWKRDHEEFDFLIGDEAYKYHYATHERLVGPLGRAALRQRLLGDIRRAVEAGERPRRLRRSARDLALRSLQLRFSRQARAAIDDAPYRELIEANTPGWPRLRFVDPGDCQLALLMAHASADMGTVVAAGSWAKRELRRARSLAREGLRQLSPAPTGAAHPAAPLRLGAGDLVLVKAREEIAGTLADGETGGLGYQPRTMDRHGGEVFRVQRRVGPYYDARGRRVVEPRGAVVLEGARCDGSPAARGCDRQCDLFWSEAWLERVEDGQAPTRSAESAKPTSPQPLMRVRSQAAIEGEERARPDSSGLRFEPATMASFCGRTLRVRAPVAHVYDHRRDCAIPLQEVFLLEGAHCSGAPLLAAGGCDRRCALLWRAAWLEPVESGGQ